MSLEFVESRLFDIPKRLLLETQSGKVWIPESSPSVHDWLLTAAATDEERESLEDTISDYDTMQEFLEAECDTEELASMHWETGGPVSWEGWIKAMHVGNRAYIIEWDEVFLSLRAIVEPADNRDLIAKAFQYLTDETNVPTIFSLSWPGLQPKWRGSR